MNISLPNPKLGRSLPLVVGAVGLVVIGIASGVGFWKVNDLMWQSSSVSTSVAPSPVTTGTKDTRRLVLYLVDSKAQEATVQAGEEEAARERAGSGISDPGYVWLVLKDTEPEEDQNVREVMDSWASNPGGVEIIDRRGH